MKRQRMCNRAKKPMYKTKLDADIAIARVNMVNSRRRHRRFRDMPKRSYLCEFCHHWHLTSQTKRDAEQAD